MRPSSRYSIPKETGNSAVDRKSSGNHIEHFLCALTFPTHSKILLNPNVWITDTAAAIIHIKAHRTGLVNVRTATTAVKQLPWAMSVLKLLQRLEIFLAQFQL
jgi:hypothetical protein